MNSSWRCQKCDACLLQVHRKGVSRKKPNKNGIICHNWKLNEQKLAQVNFTLISGHKSGFNFTWKIILSFILKCSDLSDRGPLIMTRDNVRLSRWGLDRRHGSKRGWSRFHGKAEFLWSSLAVVSRSSLWIAKFCIRSSQHQCLVWMGVQQIGPNATKKTLWSLGKKEGGNAFSLRHFLIFSFWNLLV